MPLYIINYLTFTVIYILLGWAIYLPYQCGQLYLAAVYCMSAGAYFAAYSATAWGWPTGLSLLSGAVVGGIFAFVPGIWLRRAPFFASAMATLALVFILEMVIKNLDFLGGLSGYYGIPLINHLLPIALGILVVAGVFVHRIGQSTIGRAAETLRINRDVAACYGIKVGNIGMFFQIFAGALSGVAGAIYAFAVGGLFPTAFGFGLLVDVLAMIVVGGTLTMWGIIVFAPILWGIPLILPEAIAEFREAIFGGLLIVILIWRPEGVISRAMVAKVGQACRNLRKRWIPNPSPSND